MKKNYEEFKQQIEEDIKAALGKTHTVKVSQVVKTNDIKLDGMTAILNDAKVQCSPTIYIKDLYDDYLEGISYQAIMQETVRQLLTSEIPFNVQNILDFDVVKDKICYSIINAEHSQELLKNLPHRKFLDLAIIYYIQVQKDGIAKISNSIMNLWGLTEEELYDLAQKNTPQVNPPELKTINEILRDMMKNEGMPDDMLDMMFSDNDIPLYVLSNQEKYNGAIYMTEGKYIEHFADEKDSDIIVLPSSIHEVLLIPDNGRIISKEELMNMVHDVNTNQVAENEQLSDNIYKYVRAQHELVMI